MFFYFLFYRVLLLVSFFFNFDCRFRWSHALASSECLARLVADLRGNLVGDSGEREIARAVGELPLERLELRLGGNCRSSGAGALHHELKNAVRKLQTGGCICDFSY